MVGKGELMTPDRIKAVLQQIHDRVSRNDLHGQSLRGLKKRGLIRAQYSNGENGLETKYYLTNAGRDYLVRGQGQSTPPETKKTML